MMKKAVKMPALTDTMESGRLLRWLKQAGDQVTRGDVIAEIETDKAITELETFEQGYLAGPLADEDSEVAVGTTIGWITEQPVKGGEGKAETEAESAATEKPASGVAKDLAARKEAIEPEEEKEIKKKRDASSAPRAATRSAVVEAAFAHRTSAPDAAAIGSTPELEAGPPYRIEPQASLRRVIAEAMIATTLTPQFRVSSRASLEALKAIAKERGLSFTILLAKACALTVAEYPDFNSAWTPEGLARRSRVDVGIAMETEKGLTSPVLRDVAQRPVAKLAEDWRNLKDRVKNHRARPEEYRGATFYLSNLGTFPNVYAFDAIVPLGAAAILAVAAATEQGTMLTLACDHRLLFGADAARFLQSLGDRLRDPAGWME